MSSSSSSSSYLTITPNLPTWKHGESTTSIHLTLQKNNNVNNNQILFVIERPGQGYGTNAFYTFGGTPRHPPTANISFGIIHPDDDIEIIFNRQLIHPKENIVLRIRSCPAYSIDKVWGNDHSSKLSMAVAHLQDHIQLVKCDYVILYAEPDPPPSSSSLINTEPTTHEKSTTTSIQPPLPPPLIFSPSTTFSIDLSKTEYHKFNITLSIDNSNNNNENIIINTSQSKLPTITTTTTTSSINNTIYAFNLQPPPGVEIEPKSGFVLDSIPSIIEICWFLGPPSTRPKTDTPTPDISCEIQPLQPTDFQLEQLQNGTLTVQEVLGNNNTINSTNKNYVKKTIQLQGTFINSPHSTGCCSSFCCCCCCTRCGGPLDDKEQQLADSEANPLVKMRNCLCCINPEKPLWMNFGWRVCCHCGPVVGTPRPSFEVNNLEFYGKIQVITEGIRAGNETKLHSLKWDDKTFQISSIDATINISEPVSVSKRKLLKQIRAKDFGWTIAYNKTPGKYESDRDESIASEYYTLLPRIDIMDIVTPSSSSTNIIMSRATVKSDGDTGQPHQEDSSSDLILIINRYFIRSFPPDMDKGEITTDQRCGRVTYSCIFCTYFCVPLCNCVVYLVPSCRLTSCWDDLSCCCSYSVSGRIAWNYITILAGTEQNRGQPQTFDMVRRNNENNNKPKIGNIKNSIPATMLSDADQLALATT
jgi:hypothetical protein